MQDGTLRDNDGSLGNDDDDEALPREPRQREEDMQQQQQQQQHVDDDEAPRDPRQREEEDHQQQQRVDGGSNEIPSSTPIAAYAVAPSPCKNDEEDDDTEGGGDQDGKPDPFLPQYKDQVRAAGPDAVGVPAAAGSGAVNDPLLPQFKDQVRPADAAGVPAAAAAAASGGATDGGGDEVVLAADAIIPLGDGEGTTDEQQAGAVTLLPDFKDQARTATNPKAAGISSYGDDVRRNKTNRQQDPGATSPNAEDQGGPDNNGTNREHDRLQGPNFKDQAGPAGPEIPPSNAAVPSVYAVAAAQEDPEQDERPNLKDEGATRWSCTHAFSSSNQSQTLGKIDDPPDVAATENQPDSFSAINDGNNNPSNSLPSEIPPDTPEVEVNKNKQKHVFWASAAVVVAVIVSVVVIVIMVSRGSSSTAAPSSAPSAASEEPSLAPSAGPSAAPSSGPSSAPSAEPAAPTTQTPTNTRPDLQDVMQFLLDNNVSLTVDLLTENSPQQRAATWLARDDPANLPVPTPENGTDIETVTGYRYMARYVLALDYFAWEGDAWADDLNFLSGDNICFWNKQRYTEYGVLELGVFCDIQQQPDPRYLHFNGIGLKGAIPTENGLLTALKSFEVQGNEEVTGSIPQELCNLDIAENLSLAKNSLTGQIPSCLGDLGEHLSTLHLYGNLLEGPIPAELGLLSNSLHQLIIDDNMLTGPLPDELGNLKHLYSFFFYDNPGLTGNPTGVLNQMTNLEIIMGNGCGFSGDIDETFLANLPNITGIDLSHNEFTSSNGLPGHLFAKPYMQVLDLSMNQLQGPLPTDIKLDQPFGPEELYFNFLSLYGNKMNGQLPTQLANLVGLDHLDLSMNEFTGPIPDFIGDFKAMQFLFLSANSFDDGPIPDTFEKLSGLQELSLRGTDRTGSLPTYIGTNLTKLQLLDLSNNTLEGDIPESYGSLEALEFLLLNNNPDISGEIPSTFSNLKQLQGFFLDGTGITGDLDVVCELPKFANISGQEGIFADCAGGPITCSCGCICYDGSDGGEGSQTNLGNLDASWENRFRRSNLKEKFVLLNGTEYIDPDVVSPTP